MNLETVKQFTAASIAPENGSTTPLAIEQDQRDVGDLMLGCKLLPARRLDVGNQILDVGIVKVAQRASRLLLQCATSRALWIMDLDNRGLAVADP